MFKVYWTSGEGVHANTFDNLSGALKECEVLRKCGMSFVTMVSEDPNSVGKPGVDAVVDGVCPDGVEYSWKKRRI